jgi:hypothetical protein
MSTSALALKKPICGGFTCTTANGKPGVTNPNHFYQHPEIILSFWQGSAHEWTSASQSPSRSQYVADALSMINGPYFAMLDQYANRVDGNNTGTIGNPRLAPFAPIYTGPAPGSQSNSGPVLGFGNADVINVINDQIDRGVLPPPQNGVDMVYAVMVPSRFTFCGTGVGPCLIASNFGGYNFGGNYRGTNYIALWASSPVVLSHELVEAITLFEGINLTGCTTTGGGSVNQIGDFCQCYSQTENGVPLQAYWSNVDGACVVPDSWANLYENDYKGQPWQEASVFYVRQAYGGPIGLVATDVSDNVQLSEGSSHVWTQIATTQFSELAPGTNIIAGLSMDTKAGVLAWFTNSFTPGWSNLGTPNNDVVTGVHITSDDMIFVTDSAGQPWRYDFSRDRWIQFGGWGDQFVAGGRNVFAITPDHQKVVVNNESSILSGGPWLQANGSASHLVTNTCAGLYAALSLDSNQSVLYPEGDHWDVRSQNGFYSIVVSNALQDGSGNPLVALPRPGPSPVANRFDGAPWQSIGGFGGHLVAGCEIYVTGCPGGICVPR